ncbi:hypothetical protein MFU01_60960 [Myxococcus fulvus]|uniref:Lipoprotein n=1 Tax=Myxococcus fulvus TaxID=33 RepID=A0A511TA65_MYXFU|nr:hypothetical protein MFU01_60960 [Myxococcus fulvus]
MRDMRKARMLAGWVMALQGCVTPASTWKGEVVWPDEDSSVTLVEPTEAGAVLAGAGAIRQVVKSPPVPNLFTGCSSPEQGLDVSVFSGATPGLYFVVVEQGFHRCGGPSGRVLDWWEVYAVTAQGEVVAKAPVPASEPLPPMPAPKTGEDAAPPASPSAPAPETPAPHPPRPDPS